MHKHQSLLKSTKLTQAQKDRFRRLKIGLDEACSIGEFNTAKVFANDIRSLSKATNQEHRYLLALNILSEAYINHAKYDIAIRILNSIIGISRCETRLRIEAYALLAISYMRINNINEAKKNITKSIINIKNIRSEARREIFYKKIVLRMEEESILAGAIMEIAPNLNVNEIQNEAIKLIQTKDEQELLTIIGNNIPDSSINIMNDIRSSTLLQIPYYEKLALPPPNTALPQNIVGNKSVGALKLVLWKVLCDKNDDIYKEWSSGVAAFYDKKILTGAIVGTFLGLKIGTAVLASAFVAFVIRVGCKVFCEAYAPDSIMQRDK